MGPQEVKSWRRSERERLISERMAMPPEMRRRAGEQIAQALAPLLSDTRGAIGVYWPFRAEFDPRPLIHWAVSTGRTIALPVVIDKRGPLEYRAWRPGEALIDGIWNIPIPEKRDVVIPSAVLAPLVGFDLACYRLGYGGGYFDRTLASLARRPFAIGVGFELAQLATIHPQDFDIPMDVVVTEAAVRRRRSN